MNKKASGAQCFIMALGLFWDIATGLPWTPNSVGSLEPRGYCIFLPGAYYLTINSPDGADSLLNKPLLLLLLNPGSRIESPSGNPYTVHHDDVIIANTLNLYSLFLIACGMWILQGMPTVLHSQFRITYTMILNLLRVEQLRIEDMMRKSFSEFHNQKHSSEHEERLKRLMEEMKNMADVFDYSGDLYAYYDACDEYHKLKSLIQVSPNSNLFCVIEISASFV